MKIFVRAKPNSRAEKVEKISGNTYWVYVKEPPEEGRANEAISRALAKHFNVPLGNVRIKVGHTGRQKIVEIDGVSG